MKKILKQINALVKKIASSPNVIIIFVSLISSGLLLVTVHSISRDSRWSDFFINLSASMLIVCVTVILVDILRNRHLIKQYALPRALAIDRIKVAHTNILMGIEVQYFRNNKTFMKEFMDSGTDDSKTGSTDAILTKYLKIMVSKKSTTILSNYNGLSFKQSLKVEIDSIKSELDTIIARYSFSLTDIDLRTGLVGLIEGLENVSTMFSIIENIDSEDLVKLSKKPISKYDAEKQFISIKLVPYFKKYIKFLEKYDK